MTVEVFIRDQARQIEGQVSAWSTVTYHALRRDVGRWTLVTSSADDAAALTPTVNASGVVTAPKGVVIRNDGVTIASGWCSGVPNVRHEGGVTEWTFSGWDDTVLLADALVWPSPAAPITSQGAYRTFPAGSSRTAAARTLVTENVITRLAIPGVVVGAAPSTPALTAQERYRFTSLLEACQRLAYVYSNFAVRQRDSDAALVFEQWLPADKRLDVQFSPDVGTVTGWSYEVTEPEATRVVVAAGGELEARGLRLYVNSADESSWAGTRRIERFKDRRDIDITEPDWPDEAAAEGAEFLEESKSRATFTIDATGLGMSYGVDYTVGDLVRAYIGQDADGQPVGLTEDLLEEATVTWSAEGERAELRIGSTDTAPGSRRDNDLRLMGRRIADLEKRL